jgi:putative DNA primase/helicase
MDGGFPDTTAAKEAVAANMLLLYPGAPLISAREFLRAHHTRQDMPTLHHQNATFYGWEKTHYTEAKTEEVRAALYAFLDEAFRPGLKPGEVVPFSPTKSKVANVMEALAAEAQLPAVARPPSWIDDKDNPPAVDLVSCANGLLHLPTRKLMPHTPAFFSLNALDFDYQPNAPPPTEWLKFLKQLWPDDQQSIDML